MKVWVLRAYNERQDLIAFELFSTEQDAVEYVKTNKYGGFRSQLLIYEKEVL